MFKEIYAPTLAKRARYSSDFHDRATDTDSGITSDKENTWTVGLGAMQRQMPDSVVVGKIAC